MGFCVEIAMNCVAVMCGSDATDDLETPSGSLALTENAFGNNSLYVNTSSGCQLIHTD